jgi:hypothetical protein
MDCKIKLIVLSSWSGLSTSPTTLHTQHICPMLAMCASRRALRFSFFSFRFVGQRPCISILVLLAFFIFPFCQPRAALNFFIYCRITSSIYPILGRGNNSRVPYVHENAKRRGSSVTGLTSEGVNSLLTVPIHWKDTKTYQRLSVRFFCLGFLC